MPNRNSILLLAPVGRDAELIATVLRGGGMTAHPLIDLPSLIEVARSGNAGALLLTAEALTGSAIHELAAELQKQPEWSDLPVLVLVPGGAESYSIGAMEKVLRELPNLTLLERPIRPVTLLSVAKSALKTRTRQYEVKRILEEKEQTALSMIESEKLAAVGRLASSIAHEINNPLEAVTNLLYLLKADDGLSEQGRYYMDTAERELARVSQIAAQTLRFHRQSTSPTSVRPEDLLQEVLNVYRSRLTNSAIKVNCLFGKELRVTCYEGDVRQVLSNLIGNAFDVMRTGGNLTLRTQRSTWWRTGQQGVMITVADDGTGMSASVQERIFDAFYSTKGIHGTGLGLWISKRIMQKHGGHLTVRSYVGKKHGTVFHVWLPFELAKSAGQLWHTEN